MKKYFLSIYTIHLLVWAIFFYLNYSYFKTWLPQISVAVSDTTLILYIVFCFIGVYFLAVYINQFLLLPKLYLKKKYAAYVISVLLLIMLVCFIKVEIDTMYIVTKADWLRTPGHYISTLPYLLFSMGLSSWQVMANAHQQEKQRADTLQKIQTEAELKWLKAQINPHFLFNSLNNIYSLVYLKSDEAAPMLLKLSDMMRYVMNDSNRKTVSIEEEIKYTEQFVELNGLKKVNREKTQLTIINDSIGLQVEPMLFINFIENAYKHSNMDEAGAWIKINWHISNQQIVFGCSNTCNPIGSKDAVVGIGLSNVKNRLALLYPGYNLKTAMQDNVFKVELLIPLF
jgi:two-component system, LytTR family, sensor kinase